MVLTCAVTVPTIIRSDISIAPIGRDFGGAAVPAKEDKCL